MTLSVTLGAALFATLALAVPGQDVDRSRGAIPRKPPLVRWQRTLADAEATAQATGQPLLICVNMNFEPASERLAHDRYTDSGFAELARGFVAVLASPDRHTEKDYDERGRRVPCPRFGCVTCGEHIAIEPLLFAKYFAGNRVAPRHMGIGRDGSTLFDIYLTNDLGRIDEALRQHGKAAAGTSLRSSAAREQEEAAYLAAPPDRRRGLLDAVGRAKPEPYDVVRLGLREDDALLRAHARRALAALATPAAQSLVIETLDEEPERSARADLLRVLDEIADDKPETKLARRVHRAMLADAKVVDRAAWIAALAQAAPEPPLDPDEDLDARIEELSKAASAGGAPAATFVELGESTLRFARLRMAQGKDVRFLLADAEQAAERALGKDGKDGKAHALRAEVAYLLAQRDRAAEHARKALPALLASGDVATNQAAAVLAGLAEGSAQAIYQAEAKRATSPQVEWESELLAEADTAYAVLAAHPAGTAAQAGAYVDLLQFLGLRGCARGALRTALQRFPAEAKLHERFRSQVVQERGMAGMTAAYAELDQVIADRASVGWFAGYAELVAAEHHKRQGDDRAALAAYERSAAAMLASQRANPGYAESAAWYGALASAGRARVQLDLGDVAAAGTAIAEAIERLPAIAEQEDGLGRTPLFTLKQVLERCTASEHTEVRAELERKLTTAAPEVWAKATGQ